MAKGKNAQKAANRRNLQHQARVAALQAEIAAERETIAAVAAEVEASERLHERLQSATEARSRETQPEVEALRAEADLLHRLRAAQRAAMDRVDHEWERVSDQVIDRNGGGREGVEWLMHATGTSGFLVDDSRSLSSSRATRLQKIRGDRKNLPREAATDRARHNEAAGYLSLLRPHYQRAWTAAGLPEDSSVDLDRADLTPEQRATYESTRAAVKTLMTSHPTSLSVDVVRSWHPLPWVISPTAAVHVAAVGTQRAEQDGNDQQSAPPTPNSPTGEIGQTSEIASRLGAVWSNVDESPNQASEHDSTTVSADSSPPREWPAPTPALSAVSRRRAAHADPQVLAENWRSTLAANEALVRILGPAHGPLRVGPRHPRPGRAASLRHLYTEAALGNWIRELDDHTHAHAISGATGQFPAAPGTALWGQTCVALAVAAPFWLPRGQTVTFADSEPLTPEDVGELLLPFPQVFLAFAEPILVTPHREPTTREAQTLGDLDQAASLLRSKNPTFRDLITSVRDLDNFGALTLDTVLDIRGAQIEGVLVMADSLGRIEDTFAWCAAIPSGADGTLGRHVIPARLSSTAHRSLIENLIAVAAWADWHAPDADTDIPLGPSADALVELMNTPQFKRDADRTGGGGVRVLNVRATNRQSSTSPDGIPVREIAPHVRRGHWRRQRFGIGSKQIKRIRIAPVIVNAHRGNPETRVYTLPSPVAST